MQEQHSWTFISCSGSSPDQRRHVVQYFALRYAEDVLHHPPPLEAFVGWKTSRVLPTSRCQENSRREFKPSTGENSYLHMRKKKDPGAAALGWTPRRVGPVWHTTATIHNPLHSRSHLESWRELYNWVDRQTLHTHTGFKTHNLAAKSPPRVQETTRTHTHTSPSAQPLNKLFTLKPFHSPLLLFYNCIWWTERESGFFTIFNLVASELNLKKN